MGPFGGESFEGLKSGKVNVHGHPCGRSPECFRGHFHGRSRGRFHVVKILAWPLCRNVSGIEFVVVIV